MKYSEQDFKDAYRDMEDALDSLGEADEEVEKALEWRRERYEAVKRERQNIRLMRSNNN